jgi:hypothetical protein
MKSPEKAMEVSIKSRSRGNIKMDVSPVRAFGNAVDQSIAENTVPSVLLTSPEPSPILAPRDMPLTTLQKDDLEQLLVIRQEDSVNDGNSHI